MLDSGTVLYDVQWDMLYDGEWDTVICWTVEHCYMMDIGTLLCVGQWDTVV